MARFTSLIIFVVTYILGTALEYMYEHGDHGPGLMETASFLLLVSPFAFAGAALARISRKVAAGLIVLGFIALVVGFIIVRMEPDGILTGLIPLGGLGVILGVLAHRLLDRPAAPRGN